MKRTTCLLLVLAAHSALRYHTQAATVTLNAGDLSSQASFTTAGNWSNASAPAAGNAYVDSGGFLLRTPNDGGSYTFAGDSLTFSKNGDSFALKGTAAGNTITVNSLTISGNTGIGASSAASVLAGNITVTSPATATFSGSLNLNVTANITGTGLVAAAQTGGTTVTLSGTNSYSGTTSVTAGTLLVNGTNSGAGAVTGASGTILGGIGSIAGATTVNGTITGAASGTVGKLTLTSTSGATIGATGTYLVDLTSTTSDDLNVSAGALTITAGAALTFAGTTGAASYDLANYTSETGTFAVTSLPSGYTLRYGATELDLVVVPESATWVAGLLSLGTLGVHLRRRFAGRRRQSA